MQPSFLPFLFLSCSARVSFWTFLLWNFWAERNWFKTRFISGSGESHSTNELWMIFWRHIVWRNFFFLLILPSAYSLRLKSGGTQGDKKKNWLVRLTKAESQTKLLGLQIKMLAWIKCLVKILKLSFSFHLVECLLRHHVNAGKSLTWCGTVQPPTSWLAFGTLTSLRLFPQSWVLWDGF